MALHRQGLLRSGKAAMLYRCVKHYLAVTGSVGNGGARQVWEGQGIGMGWQQRVAYSIRVRFPVWPH